MTHSVSTVLTLVAVALILLLTRRFVPEVRVLEAAIELPSHAGEDEIGPDGGPPPAILVAVEPRDFVVGEENRAARHFATFADLRAELHSLERSRPERTQVVIRAADGVSYARIVAVLDAAAAEELLAPSIVLKPVAPMFDEDDWVRAGFRPERERG